MKKSGFTLVELLGVIVLLAIISGLAVLSYNSVINNGKKGLYKNYETTLKGAAQNYFIDNIDNIPSVGSSKNISYDTLVSKNYIDEFKDPNGGTCSTSYVKVTRNNDKNNNFDLKYTPCLICKNGDNITYNTNNCDAEASGNENSNSGTESNSNNNPPSISQMCPSCSFLYLTDPDDILWYKKHVTYYEDVIKKSFISDYDNVGLGIIYDQNNKITRGFVCGRNNNKPYCVEGSTDGSTVSKNIEYLQKIFSSSQCKNLSSSFQCSGDTTVKVFFNGSVNVRGRPAGNGIEWYEVCVADNNGGMYCYEDYDD